MRKSLAGLAHDALTLAELQVQLFSVDLRDARRGAGAGLLRVLIGGVLALGSIPVLLMAGVYCLVEYLRWTTATSCAAVGVVAALLALLLLYSGWRRSVRALATVNRSRAELTETLQWLKSSLRGGGRAAPYPSAEHDQLN